jgi:hypothetical protein
MNRCSGQGHRAGLSVVALLVLGVAAACDSKDARTLELSPARVTVPASSPVCETPNDCPSNRPHCLAGLCVECAADADCDDKNPSCYRGSCVACTADAHCARTEACNDARHVCALVCQIDADCAGQREARCNGTHCVECTTPEHCDDKHPYCAVPSGTCVECLTSADCSVGVCDPGDRRCVECVADEDCPDGTCDDKGVCHAPCQDDDDCPKAAARCSLAERLCVQCLADPDCDPMHPVCGPDGKCAECAVDADCTQPGLTVCIKARGTCGQCTADAQCGDAGSCDLEHAECVGPTP